MDVVRASCMQRAVAAVVVGADIIFPRLRQKQNLRPIESRNVRHVRFYRAEPRTGIVSRLGLLTRSARILNCAETPLCGEPSCQVPYWRLCEQVLSFGSSWDKIPLSLSERRI